MAMVNTLEPYQQLEKEFSEWVHAPNTVACATGTAALQLAFESLPIPKQSGVLMPDFTMIACPRAAKLAGLTPVFCDINSDNLLIRTDGLEQIIESHNGSISCILAVHLYGRICDMDELYRIARKYKLVIVEDCAEAHGMPTSGYADAYCWSFYKNKIVHGEEGGMVSFKDPDVAEKARLLRSLGFTVDHDFFHLPGGISARLSNVHAWHILKSLWIADEQIARRWVRYNAMWDATPPEMQMPKPDVPWVYDMRLPDHPLLNPKTIVRRLNQMGIEARRGFQPMTGQEEFKQFEAYYEHPNSYVAAGRVIYLPIHPNNAVQAATDAVQAVLDLCSGIMAS